MAFEKLLTGKKLRFKDFLCYFFDVRAQNPFVLYPNSTETGKDTAMRGSITNSYVEVSEKMALNNPTFDPPWRFPVAA